MSSEPEHMITSQSMCAGVKEVKFKNCHISLQLRGEIKCPPGVNWTPEFVRRIPGTKAVGFVGFCSHYLLSCSSLKGIFIFVHMIKSKHLRAVCQVCHFSHFHKMTPFSHFNGYIATKWPIDDRQICHYLNLIRGSGWRSGNASAS